MVVKFYELSACCLMGFVFTRYGWFDAGLVFGVEGLEWVSGGGMFYSGIVLLVSLLVSFSALARCELSRKDGHVYVYEISDAECKSINYSRGYSGGRTVRMIVRYPDAQVVVESKRRDEVVFRLMDTVNENFNFWRVFEGRYPIRYEQDMKVYDLGSGDETYMFSGEDGEGVLVEKKMYTWQADRLFEGVSISYQYSEDYLDFKLMDDFALFFLRKIKAK
ncbi:hypothetical protein J4P02_23055 [Pseudomonas sp. NFXW11]|uniref:hypothetical protein n=1 Tax=Pseudomonas sp. NFXW11 TaxID=2819531 RepID=UPI003CECA20A